MQSLYKQRLRQKGIAASACRGCRLRRGRQSHRFASIPSLDSGLYQASSRTRVWKWPYQPYQHLDKWDDDVDSSSSFIPSPTTSVQKPVDSSCSGVHASAAEPPACTLLRPEWPCVSTPQTTPQTGALAVAVTSPARWQSPTVALLPQMARPPAAAVTPQTTAPRHGISTAKVVQQKRETAHLLCAYGSFEAGYVEIEWKKAGLWPSSKRVVVEIDFGSKCRAHEVVAFGTTCTCAASVSSYANGVLSIELRRGFKERTRFSWVSRILVDQHR